MAQHDSGSAGTDKPQVEGKDPDGQSTPEGKDKQTEAQQEAAKQREEEGGYQ